MTTGTQEEMTMRKGTIRSDVAFRELTAIRRERAVARRTEREAKEREQAEADAAAGCNCPLCNGRTDDPAGIHGRRK